MESSSRLFALIIKACRVRVLFLRMVEMLAISLLARSSVNKTRKTNPVSFHVAILHMGSCSMLLAAVREAVYIPETEGERSSGIFLRNTHAHCGTFSKHNIFVWVVPYYRTVSK